MPGWLRYLLTGRYGFFSVAEASIHIVDSMFNQCQVAEGLQPHSMVWRPIASLNYLLSSHVWRQDHKWIQSPGPGFIDHVVNKKAEVIRVYFPDANCLLSVTDHCLRSRNYVNVVVAGSNRPAVAHDGRRRQTSLRRPRDLGMGQQRQGKRARRGDGLLRWTCRRSKHWPQQTCSAAICRN